MISLEIDLKNWRFKNYSNMWCKESSHT